MSRRGGPGTVVFDLDPDDGGEPSLPAYGSAPEDPATEVAPGLLARGYARVKDAVARQPRRRLVRWTAAVTGSAVVVAGTVGVVVHVRSSTAERERVARVLASPGGVLDLSGPLVEGWSTAIEGDVLGTLPGTVVVADGGDVVGITVAGTDDGARPGSERWRHPLGGGITCGYPWYQPERLPQPTELVCLAGPAEARRVTVLDAAGGAHPGPDLGDTSDLQLAPGPDGSLVTVTREGPEPELPTIATGDMASDSWTGALGEGQSAVVTVTDAETGAPRWRAEVPFVGVEHLELCGYNVTNAEDGSERYELNLIAGVQAWSGYVEVRGCGLGAGTFTSDGRRMATLEDPDNQAWFAPLASGGYVSIGQATGTDGSLLPRMRSLDASGAVRFDVTGTPLLPPVADAAYPQTLVGGEVLGTVRALDPAGHELWKAKLPISAESPSEPTLLGLVDGAALFATATGVRAYGLTDGSLLWERKTEAVAGLNQWRSVSGAVTDGRTLVLNLYAWGDPSTEEQSGNHLVGVDVATGETWELGRHGESLQLLTVDGHLVEYDGSNEATGSDLGDGEWAMARTGTLSLLVPGEAEERSRATP